MRKRMWHRKRCLMFVDRGISRNSSIEVLVLVGCSVGHVVRSTLRDIFHGIRVVGLRYIAQRRHTLLGTLVRVFHISMRHWTTIRKNTRNLSLRWTIIFVIRLFLFWLTLDYASPDLVDKCGLNKESHVKSWLVQLSTGTKKRVHHWVRACTFYLYDMHTTTNLNVLLLGSCSMLLGMDWLCLHRTKVECYDKAIEYVDENGELRTLQGKKKATWVRMVTAMQAKCRHKKGLNYLQ